jgi:hypothetical protein
LSRKRFGAGVQLDAGQDAELARGIREGPAVGVLLPERLIGKDDPDARLRPPFGITFEALIFVTMRYEDRETVAAFESAVEQVPQILSAQRLFGDPDYLMGESGQSRHAGPAGFTTRAPIPAHSDRRAAGRWSVQ